MFLITKDIHLIINSDFFPVIVFCFKIAVMAPLTLAERAMGYREKNKEKIREREALRKKLRRVEIKASNPENNKARLLEKRLYKREYRKRMKDQLSPISDSIKEGFNQRSSHMRLEAQERGVLLCQVWQKSFSCVCYLNIHKVIEDHQSKILMQTKNLS